MKKLLFSEKQIGFLALSICTKGYSKRLMKNRRNLDKKKRELEEELCTLVDGNQPVFWQFDEKRKYEFCHNPFSMPKGGKEALENDEKYFNFKLKALRR